MFLVAVEVVVGVGVAVVVGVAVGVGVGVGVAVAVGVGVVVVVAVEVVVGVKFDNNDVFGDMSFLDILEDSSIPYIYKGGELTFPNRVYEFYADELWYKLTGKSFQGV